MSRTKISFLSFGAALFICLFVTVICGSNGFRNWDFDTWFNHWGKGRSAHTHMVVMDYGKSPTCTESGLTDGKHCFTCKAVIAKQQEIPATGHMEVVDNSVSPTCTESGLTDGKHCSACDMVLVEQQIIPAIGHTEIVDIGKVATCADTGLTDGKHCTTCGKVLVERTVIPISDHSYISDCCKFCGLDRSGYYLVGTFNDWQWSDKYKFEPYIIPPENSMVKEQKKLTVTLDEGTQFKIWKGNGDWSYSYYDNYGGQDDYGGHVWDDYLTIADDSLTNCEIFTITQSGTYTIYLKFFSDGGGSIYCQKL